MEGGGRPREAPSPRGRVEVPACPRGRAQDDLPCAIIPQLSHRHTPKQTTPWNPLYAAQQIICLPHFLHSVLTLTLPTPSPSHVQVVNQGFDTLWESNNKGKLFKHMTFPEPEAE